MIMSNRNKFTIIFFIFIQLFHSSCHRFNPQDLKDKYSAEVINYFYETVFYFDLEGRKENLEKWNKDIYYYLVGDYTENDIGNLQTVVSQLKSLQLPINFHLTSDSLTANLFVHFGNTLYIEEIMGSKNQIYYPFAGIARSFRGKSSYREKGLVGIPNDARTYKRVNREDSIKLRYLILLEEITQTLGVSGDSWHYPNSIFFEGPGFPPGLSDIDKGVVKMLYETSIPALYSKQQFEKNFSDVLYHVNAPQKIADYVSVNQIPLHFLEYIRNHSFHGDSFSKWPAQIYISMKGDYTNEDSVNFNKVVDVFNSVSNQLQLIIGTVSPDNCPSIVIHYKCGTKLEGIISDSETTVGGMMFPRRLLCDIRTTNKTIDSQALNKGIFNSLYCALGFDHNNSNDNVFEIDSLGNISFKPDYKEMLALIYEPVFYSGLKLSEFDEALEILKTKGYNNEK